MAIATERRPETVAAHLRLAITRAARRLRQEGGPDLSPSQASALATIERRGPLTPSDLAERERVKRPTATKVAAKLEEMGLVVRTADPGDGRSSILAISKEGRDLLARLRRRKTAYLASRLQRLSAEDVATLDRAARIIEGILEEPRP